MIRKFKTLGVAIVAVLALSAVVASAASAANYTASSYPTTGTGTSAVGNDTFITEAGKVECASHYEGTLTGPSSSLTVKATYTSCKAFGFLSAKVAMNGCDYTFTTPTGTAPNFTAPVDVTCPAGATISITSPESSPVCTTTIGAQGPLSSVAITNVAGSPGDVTVKSAVKNIAYTVTQDGFGCPFNGTGAKTGAEYIQDSAVTFKSTNGATIDVG
jgi:hypothetical protein